MLCSLERSCLLFHEGLVRTLGLWERGTKQTLIKIRAPRLSWGHSEWISARSRRRNLLAAELTHQAVWRKQRLLKELYSAAIRFLYHLCTLIGFCLWQLTCKTPSFNDEWRQLSRGRAITLEMIWSCSVVYPCIWGALAARKATSDSWLSAN